MVSGNINRTLIEEGLKLPKHDKSEFVNEKNASSNFMKFILKNPDQP